MAMFLSFLEQQATIDCSEQSSLRKCPTLQKLITSLSLKKILPALLLHTKETDFSSVQVEVKVLLSTSHQYKQS